MNSPIEMSNGQSTVKIYTGSTRGRAYYQISFYRAGRRERRTFSDKQEAKREAKAILGQLASQAADVEEAITATDVESLVAARAALKGIDLPLHLVVEGFAEAVRKLGAPANPVVAVNEAVMFYLKHHPVGFKRSTLGEMMQAYIDSRKRIGISQKRIGAVGSIFRMMRKRFSPEEYGLPSREKVLEWLEDIQHHPVTKNSYLRVLKAFAKWAVKEKREALETITEIDLWKETMGEVQIYTPTELRCILANVRKDAVAIGAFAGLRSSEIMRLDWSEVNLERNFILVRGMKTKTAARRLVPVSETLKAWLLPYAKTEGAVLPMTENRVDELLRKPGMPRKPNAFRHSYISYRLAQINDAPKVAMESGNSPKMIFRHYRELVAPEDVKVWLGILPNGGVTPEPAAELSKETAVPKHAQPEATAAPIAA
jgi:integrase